MTAHVVLPVAIIVACASAWPASYGVSNEGMTQAPTLSSPVSRERQTSGSAAISGVVLDAVTGQPIANATVNVDSGLRVTSTDAKGRFVLLNLPPSPAAGYLLQASKIGYLQDGEGQAQARRGQRVVVRDGEWLSQVRLELVRLGSITGTVIDEHGAPVIGGYVRTLIRVQVSGHDRLAAGPIARTDDRGVYRIGGLRPAEYILSVPSVQSAVPADAPESIMARRRNSPVEEGSGASLGDSTVRTDPEARLVVGQYATPPPPDRNGALTYPTLFYPGARRLSDAIAIPLEAGQERAGIDFRLTPLRAWRVSGLVQPPSGPVEGVTLRLVAEGMQDLGAGAEMGTARTDRNGRFVFLNVPTGRYLLDVRPFSMEYRLAATDANRTASLPSTPATTLSGSAGGVIGSGSSATPAR